MYARQNILQNFHYPSDPISIVSIFLHRGIKKNKITLKWCNRLRRLCATFSKSGRHCKRGAAHERKKERKIVKRSCRLWGAVHKAEARCLTLHIFSISFSAILIWWAMLFLFESSIPLRYWTMQDECTRWMDMDGGRGGLQPYTPNTAPAMNCLCVLNGRSRDTT